LFYISSLSQTLMSKKWIVLLQCQTYFQFATYPRIGNVWINSVISNCIFQM
jgi:hypothetical protein